ncbi:YbaB/EbfC family nucleoid-associated protein [Mycolicibacterium sp. P1-18]|uniref:YbaB/EbfC family nucleoid-associated protein n=1 Tax=Mycolicibacterium sp. P1-18 TaxID=2024615 RepID=UPI001566C8C5|nr:YbaB/EbfC family nucleoid-associated protein [Mycolicibacterium sp. P1-18]
MNSRLEAQRDVTVALNEQIASLSVTVSAPDGSVSVQVNGSGAITGLKLSDRAYRLGADAIAARIVEVSKAAAKVVADRQVFLLNEFGERARALRDQAQ